MLARLLRCYIFSVLTLSALAWFMVSVIGLISQLLHNAPVIEFDKGSMYMLGIGLGLLLLTIGGVTQGLFGKKLTPNKESLFSRGLVVSLLLMVGFPHLAHYAVTNSATTKKL